MGFLPRLQCHLGLLRHNHLSGDLMCPHFMSILHLLRLLDGDHMRPLSFAYSLGGMLHQVSILTNLICKLLIA